MCVLHSTAAACVNAWDVCVLVQDEIFDMVKPRDPYKLTLQDLVNSGQGDTVTSILIDLNGFWTYENREVLVTTDESSSADMDDTWLRQTLRKPEPGDA